MQRAGAESFPVRLMYVYEGRIHQSRCNQLQCIAFRSDPHNLPAQRPLGQQAVSHGMMSGHSSLIGCVQQVQRNQHVWGTHMYMYRQCIACFAGACMSHTVTLIVGCSIPNAVQLVGSQVSSPTLMMVRRRNGTWNTRPDVITHYKLYLCFILHAPASTILLP